MATINVSHKITKLFPNEESVSLSNTASDFRNKCRILEKSDFSSGSTVNVMKKIAKFIDSYNELNNECNTSTNRTVIQEQKNMKKLLEENTSQLKKLGISFKDNKLSINTEKLKKITTSTKLTNAFNGPSTILTKLAKSANKIASSLKDETTQQEFRVYKTIDPSDYSGVGTIINKYL